MTQTHCIHGNTIEIEFTDRTHPASRQPSAFAACQLTQVHGVRVVERSHDTRLVKPEADGHWTLDRGLSLAVKSADCVPALILGFSGSAVDRDPCQPWVAAVHAGWRSGLGGIFGELLKSVPLKQDNVNEIHVWWGPHIGECCFQVGPEVVETGSSTVTLSANEWSKPDASPGKYRVNLLEHYRAQFREFFVKRSLPLKITEHSESAECTVCHPKKYFSYRREGVTGSLFSRIQLL